MEVEVERERATDQWSERQSVGQKWKWRGLEMAVSEKGQLSISNKANQQNKQDVNQKGINIGWVLNSFIHWCFDFRSLDDASHHNCTKQVLFQASLIFEGKA